MYEQKLTFAARALAAGNLAATEIVCRDILDLAPRNSAALNLLGIVAAKIGVIDQAAAYFKAALLAEPKNGEILGNLALLNNLGRPPEQREVDERYLVIKSWGFGFWSDISAVLGSLLLAEITGRIPVTHWGKNSLFADGSGSDAFPLYFKPISNLKLQDLRDVAGATFFPVKWNEANLAEEDIAKWHGNWSRAAALYLLNRPETIAVSDFYVGVIDAAPWIPADHPMHGKPLAEVYRYLVGKYLHPHASTQAACDTFFRDHLEGAPFVAIHMRGSDKIREDQDRDATNQALLSALAAIDPGWRIFLLTDDEQWRLRIKAIHGDRVITTSCQRTSTSTGVHYLPSIDRVRAGVEVMVDTYLALRANRFIGNGRSSVSAMIALMKEWMPGDCTLIGLSQLTERNLSIHIRQ